MSRRLYDIEAHNRRINEAARELEVAVAALHVGNVAKVQSNPVPSSLWVPESVSTYADNVRRLQGQVDSTRSPHAGIYAPLNQFDDDEIRVLEISPGSPGEALTGTLHHCNVGFEYQPVDAIPDNPSSGLQTVRRTLHAVSIPDGKPIFYTALSYTWGHPIFDKPVLCNGQTIHVTATLDAALRRLRDPQISVMLWVDQICINQNDNAEKVRQVLLMREIYRHAFSTIIWLGGESDEGALDLMLHLHENLSGISGDNLPASVFERLPFQYDHADAWRIIQQFFSRFYFERTWIIQEIVLSRNSIVKCGSMDIHWDDFTAICLSVLSTGFYDWLGQNVTGNGYVLASGCGIVGDLSSMKYEFESLQTALQLSSSLIFGRHAKATDLRDKVYGTLGMCRAEIVPDYNKDLADVYREATIVCFEELGLGTRGVPAGQVRNDIFYHALFSMLVCVDHDSTISEILNKPSWVPDWSRPRSTTALSFSTSAQNIYSAGDWYEADCFTISPDRRVISLKGRVFDTITGLAEACTSPYIPERANSQDEVAAYLSFVRDNLTAPIGRDMTEVFYRTVVAGKQEDGLKACPPEYFKIFAFVFAPESNGQHEAAQHANATSQPPKETPKGKKGKKAGKKGGDTAHAAKIAARAARKLEELKEVRRAYAKAMKNRRLCATTRGYIGLVPAFAEVGDVITVFAGGLVPFVLREVKSGSAKGDYTLVGECYVQGLMNNEILRLGGTTRTFNIV